MKLTKNKFQLVSAVLSLGMAALAKAAIDNRYEASTGNSAPKNPDADDASFTRIVLYAAVTAAVGISVKLLMRKFLTKQWKKMDGELPENIS